MSINNKDVLTELKLGDNPSNISVPSKSEFKKYIQTLVNSKTCLLNCPGVNQVFNEPYEHYEISSSNMADNVSELANAAIREFSFGEFANTIKMTEAIKSTVYSFAFRTRCFGEMIKTEKCYEKILRERTDMRNMLEDFIRCFNKYIPIEPSYNVAFKNNVKGFISAHINPTEFTIVLTNLVLNALMHAHSVSNKVDIFLNRLSGKVAVLL